ncbi:MAG: hypothetical protein Q9159_001999 [Coniocarpon cinnabarinum]
MATHEVDRKILGRLATEASAFDRVLSGALFQVLGLSRMLSRRLLRARTLRRLEPTNVKAMTLYHHIIWMSREGLAIVEGIIAEYVERGARAAIELRIFAYKLRASFYHVFCLFHNKPSVSPLNPAGDLPHGEQVPTVLLPVPGNRQAALGSTPPRNGKAKDPNDPSPPSRVPTGIRDSILSDTSNVTNPFGSISGLSPPPGLPGRDPSQAPDPAAFLLPSTNFIPLTIASFDAASALAAQMLTSTSPLRLSIALEYSAFKWDCLHDHSDSRRLARNTMIRVYESQEGMDDNEYEDAAKLVGTLGRMMKRKSEDRTPRFGDTTPPADGDNVAREQARPAAPSVPEVPQITIQQEEELRQEARREQERARRNAERENVTSPRPVTAERTPAARNPPATSTTQQRPTTPGADKPLPQLPAQDPSFNIPRRPAGTPPGIKSTSRPTSAEEEVTPTQASVAATANPPQSNPGPQVVQQPQRQTETFPTRGSSLRPEDYPPRGSSLA